MHREPKQFVAAVKQQHPEFFTGKKVLEVGSLDINGSVREFFTDCDYTGIDLGEGSGVDVVACAGNFVRPNEYDVIISTEALEHDQLWPQSLKQMYANLKAGGLLVITCAAPNRPEHGTTRTGSADASPFTSDYYRNISVEDFASVLPANLFTKSYLGYRGNMDDLYFAGIKRNDGSYTLYDDPIWIDEQKQVAGTLPTTLTELVNRIGPIQFPTITETFTVANKLTVTAEISTLGRYETTLPMCISAILMQTHKPDRLVIYDDGEQKDLRELPPFDGLLRLADDLGIQWTFFSTERKGQVANHQHALDNATTDLIWRIDDDEIPEPDCLENLLTMMTEDVGAVAGLVHHPSGVLPLPSTVKGGLGDIAVGTNVQWFSWSNQWKEVEHLYSTFIFSVDAARKAGGYPRELSTIGHREESWFTIAIRQAGYKLIVTPYAKTWHLRQNSGGIRSFSDASLWQHDENLFQEYLKAIGKVEDKKFVCLDVGIGDHLLFRGVLLQHLRRLHPGRKYTVACCYPETLDDLDDVTIISIAEARLIVGDRYPTYSLYQWMWDNNWQGSVVDAMRKFWA